MRGKTIELQGPVILFRTKRFLKTIERLASLSPACWKIFGNAGVIASFLCMLLGMQYLLTSFFLIAHGEIKEPTFKLVLPSLSEQSEVESTHILVPLWMWILTVFLILFPHELAHGILARAERVRLKSVGFFLFLIFPGAFVEPDEEQLKRKKVISQLRILAVGSFANLIMAYLALFSGNAVWNCTEFEIVVEKVYKDSPAFLAGIREGEKIVAINGTAPKTFNFETYTAFAFSRVPAERVLAFMSIADILTNGTYENFTFKPGDSITLQTDRGNYTITLAPHPKDKERPYMGISARFKAKNLEFLLPFLSFFFSLSFAVAVINLLPLYPLDGGRIFEAVLCRFTGRGRVSKKIVNSVSLVVLFLLLYCFLGPFFRIP